MRQSHAFTVPVSEEDFQVPGIHQGAKVIEQYVRDSLVLC